VKLATALLCAAAAVAQSSGDPNASGAQPPNPQKRPGRIMGVVPNSRTIDPNFHPGPLTEGEKFKLATRDAFDPFSFVTSGIYAGVAQWSNSYEGYGQGGEGFAKRYGAAFTDGTVAGYLTEAILPVLFEQDPRYYRMGVGSAWRRIGYAISRVAITRSDGGKTQLNISELGGNMAAAGISDLYYPPGSRGAGDTMIRFSLNVASDAGFNVLKEFWPDMRRKILHRKD
jgi:hypothetical protein